MPNTVETAKLNIEDVDFDDERAVDAFHEAWISTGQAKVQDDFRRLQEMGIVDAQGNQLKTYLDYEPSIPVSDLAELSDS